MTKTVRRRARKPARNSRAAQKTTAAIKSTTPDRVNDAMLQQAKRLQLGKKTLPQLVALHNRIAKRKRKSFTDLATMRAAKLIAVSRGAQVKHQ